MSIDKIGRTFLFILAAAALLMGARLAGQALVPFVRQAHSGAGNLLERVTA